MSICFKRIEDSIVIVRQSYMYKQCQAYERGGNVYVGVGAGFARLREDGATSSPKITWEESEGIGAPRLKPSSGKWVKVKG